MRYGSGNFFLLEIVHDLLILFFIISDAGKYSLVIESLRGGTLAYSLIHSPLAACNSLEMKNCNLSFEITMKHDTPTNTYTKFIEI